MAGHPVMGVQIKPIVALEPVPGNTGAMLALLSPKGMLLLDRDDMHPLVVAYSNENNINVGNWVTQEMIKAHARASQSRPLGGDVYIPQLITTNWNQFPPYNLSMPRSPLNLNNENSPTGCGTAAYAQLLNHFQWPPYGEGKKTYKDTVGVMKTTFSTDYTKTYR